MRAMTVTRMGAASLGLRGSMPRLAIAVALLAAGLARGQAPALSVQVLGSGGPRPSAQASSGTLVLVDGVPRILVDVGPGTLLRAGELKIDLSAVDTVLLTHLHTDHAGELPSFATARVLDGGRSVRLRVFGPGGNGGFPSTTAFVAALLGPKGAFRYVRHFGADLSIDSVDVITKPQSSSPARASLGEGLSLSALGHHHGDAPAVGFRIEHGGRSVVLVGDVDPSGLPAVERLARDADLLVISCSVLDPPDSPPALYERHSPPGEIGAMAARARVGAVLCAHLPPAVSARADAVRRSIGARFTGPLTLASDGLLVRVEAAPAAARPDAGRGQCRTDGDCAAGQSCFLCGEQGTCLAASCETTGCPPGSVCRPVNCIRCPCPPQCVGR